MDKGIEDKIKNYRESVKRYISEDLPRNMDEKEAANEEREKLEDVIDEEDRGENVLYQRALERLSKAETTIKNTKTAAKYSIEKLITTLKERNQEIATKYMSQKPGQIQLQINFLQTENQKLEFEIMNKEQKIVETQQLIEKYDEIGDWERKTELEAKVQNLRSEVTDRKNKQKEYLAEIDTCKNFEEEYKRNTDLIKSYREIAKANEIEIELKVETKSGPENNEPANNGPENNEPTNNRPENNGPTNNGPENNGPTKTEPTKTGTTKTEPAKTGTTKTESTKTGTTKTEKPKVKWPDYLTQEQIDEAKSRDIYEPKGQEYEQFLRNLGIKPPTKNVQLKDVKITICPISNSIVLEAVGQDGKPAPYVVQDLDYTEEFSDSAQVKQIITKVQKEFGYDLYDADKLDPNVLLMLDRTGCTKELLEYVAAMNRGNENRTISSFKLNYDLKDMAKSEMMYDKEKAKVSSLAKTAKRIGAISSRDNIFKRIADGVRSWIGKKSRKQLVQENKVSDAYDKAQTTARESFVKGIEVKVREIGKELSEEQRGKVREDFDKNYEYKDGGFKPKEIKPKVVKEPVEHKKEETTGEMPPMQEETDKIIDEARKLSDDAEEIEVNVDEIMEEFRDTSTENASKRTSFVPPATVSETKAAKAVEEKKTPLEVAEYTIEEIE